MIILPTPPNGEKDIPTRWQEAITSDDMCCWYSYSGFLMQWSFKLFKAGDFDTSETLRFLSNMAYQRYLDLHPKRADDYQREQIETAHSEQHENYLRGVAA